MKRLALAGLIGLAACTQPASDEATNTAAPGDEPVETGDARDVVPEPVPSGTGNEASRTAGDFPGDDSAPTVAARIIDAPRVPPLDTCRKTGSFPVFRKKFETAVAERDFALLEPLIDYELETDFADGEDGMKAFANRWRGTDWKSSKLWDELDAIVALGCGGSEGYFAMPRMFVVDTETVDLFEAQVALGEAVPLRADATSNADVIALLDWALVTATGPAPAKPSIWTEVRTADGTRGFVKSEQLRSPIDYRAVFQLRKGGWKLTAFIAGD